jgi:hypothetical protein
MERRGMIDVGVYTLQVPSSGKLDEIFHLSGVQRPNQYKNRQTHPKANIICGK